MLHDRIKCPCKAYTVDLVKNLGQHIKGYKALTPYQKITIPGSYKSTKSARVRPSQRSAYDLQDIPGESVSYIVLQQNVHTSAKHMISSLRYPQSNGGAEGKLRLQSCCCKTQK